MPVGTFPRLAGMLPGIPLAVSYQYLCHQKKDSLSSLLRDKSSIMADKTHRSIYLRTAGSSFKNVMDVKRLEQKPDTSEYTDILFSLYYGCKKKMQQAQGSSLFSICFLQGLLCVVQLLKAFLRPLCCSRGEGPVAGSAPHGSQGPWSLQPSHQRAIRVTRKAAG